MVVGFFSIPILKMVLLLFFLVIAHSFVITFHIYTYEIALQRAQPVIHQSNKQWELIGTRDRLHQPVKNPISDNSNILWKSPSLGINSR